MTRFSTPAWDGPTWPGPRTDSISSFLSAFLPAMAAAATGDDPFQPAPPEADDPTLLLGGVVPKRDRRRIDPETLDAVVIPGFEEFRIDTGPLRQWAENKGRVVAALES